MVNFLTVRVDGKITETSLFFVGTHHSVRLFRASRCQAGGSLAWKPIPVSFKSFNQASGLKDGLQPWHSIKGNALLSAHTQSLHLVRQQVRSIINDKGSSGINWYLIHPSVRPSIRPFSPTSHMHIRATVGNILRVWTRQAWK